MKAAQPEILGIRQVKVPVTDLTQSARWYTQLLGLALHREFVEQGELAGAVLESPRRFRDQPAAPRSGTRPAIVSGFDLFSLGVSSRADLDSLAARADDLEAERGSVVDRGVDGYHLDVADPDGTVIRFLAPANADSAVQAGVDGTGFVGVAFDDSGQPNVYVTPRITLF